MTTVTGGQLSGALHAALSSAGDVDIDDLSAQALAGELARLGAAANRLAALQARVLAAVEQRRREGDYGSSTTGEVLARQQRLDPGDAARRVDLALSLMPRRTLTGELLPPIAPLTASACVAGEVSPEQAQVIVSALDAVPHWAPVETVEVIERVLVEAAAHLPVRAMRTMAGQLLAHLDQDGPEPRADDIEAKRHVTVQPRSDGTARLSGLLSTETAAALLTVFDSLAAPTPAADGERDPRTAGQRREDALAEMCQRLLRSDTLPASGGAPVTIMVTTTLDDLRAGSGVAYTDRGAPWALTALLQASADARLILAVTDGCGVPLFLGRAQRLASPGQRFALTVRDGGCCFPSCDRPAAWTEVHHIVEWQAGGPTDLNNLCLLCRYHHRNFASMGWVVQMTDGVPEWIPPRWVDTEQKPIRNRVRHRPEAELFSGTAAEPRPPSA